MHLATDRPNYFMPHVVEPPVIHCLIGADWVSAINLNIAGSKSWIHVTPALPFLLRLGLIFSQSTRLALPKRKKMCEQILPNCVPTRYIQTGGTHKRRMALSLLEHLLPRCALAGCPRSKSLSHQARPGHGRRAKHCGAVDNVFICTVYIYTTQVSA